MKRTQGLAVAIAVVIAMAIATAGMAFDAAPAAADSPHLDDRYLNCRGRGEGDAWVRVTSKGHTYVYIRGPYSDWALRDEYRTGGEIHIYHIWLGPSWYYWEVKVAPWYGDWGDGPHKVYRDGTYGYCSGNI